MQRDQFRFLKMLRKLKPDGNDSRESVSDETRQLSQRIDVSLALCEQRRAALPHVQLDEELPIFQRRDEIAEAIDNNQVVIVSGETGSGKSTQLPLIALQLGLGVRGFIGHTQPRRIAARSVANRVASQLKTNLGAAVGFKIRFDDKTNEKTYVKLMTDGILLAETQSDRFLDQYEMIIIDEAHERSLNIDFLIGNLKQILNKRRDLKILITSATIDTQRFANHFQSAAGEPAPIIDVEGRTWPVDIRYSPLEESETDAGGDAMVDHIVSETNEIARQEQGDILVFLPTENDIKTVSKKLRGAQLGANAIEVLPLYARLSTEQQNSIFQPGSRRRIILATNVAESSITVPRIRIVVDSGTARISRYAPRSKVQRLPIEPISQASANQRAGRCGRIGPGTCVRLFSEDDFLARPNFTTPEIRRTNLASVILQTLSLKLGEISTFPFLDPPHGDAISDGYRTLFEVGAIDDRRQLTSLGRKLAKLPVDPRIGRMLFAAADEGCLNEILIIASALEIQDPRIRPTEKQQQADEQHEKFRHEKSDFMSYLKIWDFFHKLRSDLSRSKYRKACQQNFLSVAMIHQWQETHRQLKNVVQQNGLKSTDRKDDFNAIHRSLLTGLLSGIAMLADRHEYTGSGGVKFHLWPGSGVFKSKPKWIVAAEVVETARRYGRTIGKISPEWIEPIAEHLSKGRYVDPHWSKKQQTVMAYENVTLFGLPIVTRRRVGYTKIDPETSRQLFIDEGLAEFQLHYQFNFLEHNQALLDEMEQLAAKARRHELILDSALLSQFYHDRLPETCVDVASLRRAIKDNPKLDRILQFEKEDLDLEDTEITANQFPDSVQIGRMDLPIEYRFEPGQLADGATIRIPKEALGQIDNVNAGWLVPGLYETRVTAMIKSLPKSLRRNLIPAPETARKVCQNLITAEASFASCVAKHLSVISGETILAEMFDFGKIDACLNINIQVVDESGELIAQGRNINELRKEIGSVADNFVDVEDSIWNQDGLANWTWGELPNCVSVQRGVASVPVFPAIIDQETGVGLRLVDSTEAAEHLTRNGLLRLFVLGLRKSLKRQVNWLPDLETHVMKLVSLIGPDHLRNGLMELIAKVALVEGIPIPRTEDEFDSRISGSVEKISMATQEVAKWLPRFADEVHTANLAREQLASKFGHAVDDIQDQIQALAVERFLISTPWTWLQHFPRYFSAIGTRCEKLFVGSTGKDIEAMERIASYWNQYEQIQSAHNSLSIHDQELTKFRWMIEEYRVSQFAQKLGTSITISEKRLEKQLARIRNA